MISQTSQYALRAVVYLATQDGCPLTTQQIAEATEMPAGYLSKIMGSLSRAKVVHSRPGRNGGFTLVKDPTELSTLEIINAVDPLERVETCPLRLDVHQEHLCALHSWINEAVDMVEVAFRNTTVADLLKVPRPNSKRCRFPVAIQR